MEQLNKKIMLKFNIPNHENELETAEILIKKFQDRFNSNNLSDVRKLALLKLTTKVLYAVGEFSEDIFVLRPEMERKYTEMYPQSPALGKKLYLEHYEGLHKPYNKLKNRAFKLIQLLDPIDEGIEEEIFF